MADKPKSKRVDVINVVRHGDKIVVPQSISMEQALKALQRKYEEEEEYTEFYEDIDSFVWDGAHAMSVAMENLYGFSKSVPTPGFFGDTPPRMISVAVNHGETVLVPWGRFQLPGIPGHVETGYTYTQDQRIIFRISAYVQRKNEPNVRALAEETRRIVREESIFRGKAFSMVFRDEDGEINPMARPEFLDLSKVQEDSLIFSRSIQAAININVFSIIERTDAVRTLGVPRKRGILLSGQYGCGKTLTAHVVAKKGTRNGWTYVYIRKATELVDALRFAKQYQPCIVFCEDIDQVTQGERTMSMNDIANTIDGVETKNTEIMVILTTNHSEKIRKVMLRPGRIDAEIEILPPDAEAVPKLVRLYGRGLIPATEDLTEVGNELAGEIPAVIAEVVERSKLAALLRNPDMDAEDITVTADDLMDAAASMADQRRRLHGEEKEIVSDLDRMGQAIGKSLASGIGPFISGMNEKKDTA